MNHNQRSFYNRKHKQHGLQFQVITLPNGMVLHCSSPFKGSAIDQSMFNESNMEELLDTLVYPEDDQEENQFYNLYGNKRYSGKLRLAVPFEGNHLTQEQKQYNNLMSSYSDTVEDFFAVKANLWKYLDDSKNQKIKLSAIGMQFTVSLFLTNIHNCFYNNLISEKFQCSPPSIEEYLG